MRLRYSIAVTLGFITCLSSFMLGLGQNDFVLPLMMFLAAVASLYFTDFRRWIRLGDWTVNVLVLIIVFCTIGDILAHKGEDMAISIARVLVFVEMILLFREKDPRFCWQILLISLLQVVVATVFQQSLFFGFLLLLYVFTGLYAFALIFFQKENQYFRKHSFINTFFDTIRLEISERQDHWKLARIALITFLTGPLSLVFSFSPTSLDQKPESDDGADSGKKKTPRQMLRSLFAVFPSDTGRENGSWETVSDPEKSSQKSAWHESLWDETSETVPPKNRVDGPGESPPSVSGVKTTPDSRLAPTHLVPVPDRERFFRSHPHKTPSRRKRFPLLNERPGFSAGTVVANGFEGGRQELFKHLVRGTLFSLFFAVLFFCLVPRFGRMEFWSISFGHDSWKKSFTKPVGTVGFSEKVRLGSLGAVLPYHREVLTVRIMKNPEQRVPGANETLNREVPYDEIQGSSLYFYGIALDHYEKGAWTASSETSQSVLPNASDPNSGSFPWFMPNLVREDLSPPRRSPFAGPRLTPPIPPGIVVRPDDSKQLFFEKGTDLLSLYLEIQPLDSKVFFAPWPFYRSEDRKRTTLKIFENRFEELKLRGSPTESLIFSTAFKKGKQLDTVPAPFPVDQAMFLQVPEYGLESLAKLADQWVRESGLQRDHVAGIARYMESQFLHSEKFHYKLGGTIRDLKFDPLEDFIVYRPSGHCEYFAGALAMMLRSVGIGSRVIVGFKIHPQQPTKNGYTIRQSDAHAWVEAYLPPQALSGRIQEPYEKCWQEGAWLRLDPTPAVDEGNLLKSVSFSLIDLNQWIQNVWGEFVLNMNTTRQAEWIYQPLRKGFQIIAQKVFNIDFWHQAIPNVIQQYKDYYAQFRGGKNMLAHGAILLLHLLGGAGIAYVLYRVWRGVASRLKNAFEKSHRDQATIEFYVRMERLLAGRGRERRPEETPLEYVRQSGFLPLTLPVVDAYYRVRYGGVELSDEEFNSVRFTLDQLETTIRHHDTKKA